VAPCRRCGGPVPNYPRPAPPGRSRSAAAHRRGRRCCAPGRSRREPALGPWLLPAWWTCTTTPCWSLKNLGLSRTNSVAGKVIRLILEREKGRDGGPNASPAGKHSDACINGMIRSGSGFGAGEGFRRPSGRVTRRRDRMRRRPARAQRTQNRAGSITVDGPLNGIRSGADGGGCRPHTPRHLTVPAGDQGTHRRRIAVHPSPSSTPHPLSHQVRPPRFPQHQCGNGAWTTLIECSTRGTRQGCAERADFSTLGRSMVVSDEHSAR
jgi:hypothetical protein